MNPPISQRVSPFERIRHVDETGEYWSARELASLLEYTQWRNFYGVVKKAMQACKASGNEVSDHFADISKMVELGSSAERRIDDFQISRYACYLVVMNGDPSKRLVALGQAYFAVQTRRAEVLAEISEKTVAEQRLILRDQLATEHGLLTELVTDAGVITQSDFVTYFDHKWEGLYAMKYRDLQQHRGLKKGETPLAYMGPDESVLNLMQAQQIRAKTERDQPQSPANAGHIAYEVGRVFRRALEEIGATMPEDLPKAEDIELVRRVEARRIKAVSRQQQIEAEDSIGLWAQLAEVQKPEDTQ